MIIVIANLIKGLVCEELKNQLMLPRGPVK